MTLDASKLLREIESVLDEGEEPDLSDESYELEIECEPELYVFDFLSLECQEHQVGMAMAMRNFWSWRSSR